MQNDKKIFGKLNGDDSEKFLPSEDYINLENAVIATNEFGKNFSVQNVPSTELLFYYTSGLNTLGTAVDYDKKRIFWLDHDEDNGVDTLFCYDLNAKTTYKVVTSLQIDDGLNLSNDYRVDRNLKIINGLAIWTDNNNEPKCIDIEAGIKLNQPGYVTDAEPYAVPISYTTSTLIKKPPIYRLIVTKVADAGFVNNYTTTHSFQFFYRYQYKNYQYSALSVISNLIPDNFQDEDYNSILIQVPLTEKIDDYVLSIEIFVRFGNVGKSFRIKKWSKQNSYEALQIQYHNDGIAQLYYYFYNNELDAALSDTDANTFFHNVPLKALTIECAKNRIFLGNVLKGYNSATSTSLSLSLSTKITTDVCIKSGSTYRASVTFFDRFKRPCGRTDALVSINVPYKDRDATTFVPSIGWTLSNTDALNEIPDFAYYYQICWSKNQSRESFVQTIAKEITYVRKENDGTIVNAGVIFDNNDTYALAIDISNLLVYGQGYSYSDGDFAVLQTQDFKTYYLRVLGQSGNNVWLTPVDLTSGYARYFWESSVISRYEDPNRYYFKIDYIRSENPSSSIVTQSINTVGDAIVIDNSKTNWMMEFTVTTFDRKFQINISALNFKAGNVGQLGTFYIRAVATHPTLLNIEVPVYTKECNGSQTYEDTGLAFINIPAGYEKLFMYLASDLPHIYVNKINIDISEAPISLSKVELYTPYSPNEAEPFYGVGDIHNVNNPTTNSRQYSVTSGIIQGDCFVLDRQIDLDDTTTYDFKVESMSPNDLTWQNWERNLGWPSFVDSIGQQRKNTFIDFSDTFINGAKVNGLNVFQPLNEKDIGASSGAIQKLQLTNKMEESGTVMLVITDTDTLSAYLGEVQLYNAASVEGLITTADVIGSVNALQNGFGTLNPESVIEYNGTVWWLSVLKGVVAEYSTNGVRAISDIKMSRFFDRWCKRYVELGKAGVKALCGFSHVASCVDVTNGLYMLVLPQTEVNTVVSGLPVGFAKALPSYDSLPDYASSIQNRFDVYDGQAKIMNYDFINNRWVGAFQWLPESMEYFGNKLFGFKDGFLYLHNENISTYNTIYGVQYPVRVCFTTNLPASEVKTILNVALESNQIPNFTVLYTNWPDEQITDLTASEYRNEEGVLYADFFRDRLSPNASGNVIDKMYNGDDIVGQVAYIMIEFQEYDEQLILNLTNIGFQLSRGQSNILKTSGK